MAKRVKVEQGGPSLIVRDSEAERYRVAAGLESLLVPIAGLVADPKNSRRHPARNLAAIQTSIEQFGQTKPIVLAADGRMVLAGNVLRLRPGEAIPDGPNDYGMRLIRKPAKIGGSGPDAATGSA